MLLKRDRTPLIADRFADEAEAAVFHGDCRDFLGSLPDGVCQLVVTSPPFNIGKGYERKVRLDAYIDLQREVAELCVRKLAPGGSLCWQVGNHVAGPQEIIPLDIVLLPVFAACGLQ